MTFQKSKSELSCRSSDSSELLEFKRTPVSYFDNALFMSMKILLGIFLSISAVKTDMNKSVGFIEIHLKSFYFLIP